MDEVRDTEDPSAHRDDPIVSLGGESLFRALIEELPAIVYICSHDPMPHMMYVSPRVTDMLGFPPEEWLSDHSLWPRTIHPFDRDRVMADWQRAVRNRTPFRCEYRLVRRGDGAVIWVSDETRLVLDPLGQPRFWQGVILDITDRHLAEETAHNSEARYQALVEGIPAIVYEMGPDDERRTLYVSRHVEEILGYSRAEWLDQPDIWMELLHPDDREVQLAAHDLHNETGAPWSREYRFIASDGREVWVRDVASLVRDAEGHPRTWQGVMLDISAQKEAEEALRLVNDELEFRVGARTAQLGDANEMMTLEIGERIRMEEQLRDSQERYRILVERLPAVVYMWDALPSEGRANYTSPMIEQLLGFTVEEWLSVPEFGMDRVHPHDRQRVMAKTLASEHTGEPFREEYRLLAKDGHIVWVHDQATMMSRSRDGRPKLFQGFLLDITDRMEAEAKASRAEERYRLLAEEGPVITFAARLAYEPALSTTIEYLSPQLRNVIGFDIGAWRNEPDRWLEVVHPDDRDHMRDAFVGSLARNGEYIDDYRIIAGDGRVVWIHAQARAIEFDDRGRPSLMQGIMLDVTDPREAAQELRASEELYRSFVERMPAIPWIESIDPLTGAGRMTFIGPQAQEWFGWSAEELLAEPDHLERMLHPEDRDRVMTYLQGVVRSGAQEWRITYRVIARDGRTIPILSQGIPVPDEDGRIRAWYGFAVKLEGPEVGSAPASSAAGDLEVEEPAPGFNAPA